MKTSRIILFVLALWSNSLFAGKLLDKLNQFRGSYQFEELTSRILNKLKPPLSQEDQSDLVRIYEMVGMGYGARQAFDAIDALARDKKLSPSTRERLLNAIIKNAKRNSSEYVIDKILGQEDLDPNMQNTLKILRENPNAKIVIPSEGAEEGSSRTHRSSSNASVDEDQDSVDDNVDMIAKILEYYNNVEMNFVNMVHDLGHSPNVDEMLEIWTKLYSSYEIDFICVLGMPVGWRNHIEFYPDTLPSIIDAFNSLTANLEEKMTTRLAELNRLAPVLYQAEAGALPTSPIDEHEKARGILALRANRVVELENYFVNYDKHAETAENVCDSLVDPTGRTDGLSSDEAAIKKAFDLELVEPDAIAPNLGAPSSPGFNCPICLDDRPSSEQNTQPCCNQNICKTCIAANRFKYLFDPTADRFVLNKECPLCKVFPKSDEILQRTVSAPAPDRPMRDTP